MLPSPATATSGESARPSRTKPRLPQCHLRRRAGTDISLLSKANGGTDGVVLYALERDHVCGYEGPVVCRPLTRLSYEEYAALVGRRVIHLRIRVRRSYPEPDRADMGELHGEERSAIPWYMGNAGEWRLYGWTF